MLKINLNNEHKRVFYFEKLEDGQLLVKILENGSKHWKLDQPGKRRYLFKGPNKEANIIGQGSFGKVYKAVDQTTKKNVAMKEISKEKMQE